MFAIDTFNDLTFNFSLARYFFDFTKNFSKTKVKIRQFQKEFSKDQSEKNVSLSRNPRFKRENQNSIKMD